MNDFLMRQFDKLLLLVLIVFFTIVALCIIHWVHDPAVINWSMVLVSSVVSSLLTLITGAIAKSSANPNNDKPKD